MPTFAQRKEAERLSRDVQQYLQTLEQEQGVDGDGHSSPSSFSRCKVAQQMLVCLILQVVPVPLLILFIAHLIPVVPSYVVAFASFALWLVWGCCSMPLFFPRCEKGGIAVYLTFPICIASFLGSFLWTIVVNGNANKFAPYMPYRAEYPVDVPVCEPSQWTQAVGAYFDNDINFGNPEIEFEVGVDKVLNKCSGGGGNSPLTCRWVSQTYTVTPIFGQKNSTVPCAWSLGGKPGCLDAGSSADFCGVIFMRNFPWSGAASKEFEIAVRAFAMEHSEITYVKDLPKFFFADPNFKFKEYLGLLRNELLLLLFLVLAVPACVLVLKQEVDTPFWKAEV